VINTGRTPGEHRPGSPVKQGENRWTSSVQVATIQYTACTRGEVWRIAIERENSGDARGPGRMEHPASCLQRGAIRPAYVVRTAAGSEGSQCVGVVPINGHTGPAAGSAAILTPLCGSH
jgi:hypothetical protein